MKVLFGVGVGAVFVGVLVFVTQGHPIPVLETNGLIANQQRDLILVTVGLGMIIVVPVFVMLFWIAWHFRAGNEKAKYEPEFASHRGLEALWWGVPIVIIVVLAIITGISTHALDPYKKIDSSVKPVKLQVIALQWKWLFIYPDEGIATLNFANIPNSTPIDLEITSDAPMNSFWVPALAGQVYAMSGMTTQLHLMADKSGTYNGWSANISGEGYADMGFKITSMSPSDFASWTEKAKQSNDALTDDTYTTLAEPSKNIPNVTYKLMSPSLYNNTVMKYMSPAESSTAHEHMEGM